MLRMNGRRWDTEGEAEKRCDGTIGCGRNISAELHREDINCVTKWKSDVFLLMLWRRGCGCGLGLPWWLSTSSDYFRCERVGQVPWLISYPGWGFSCPDWGFSYPDRFSYPDWGFLTLTEVLPCFLLSCKAKARVKFPKTGHGSHFFWITCYLCCSMYCLCVNVYCNTATEWQPNWS